VWLVATYGCESLTHRKYEETRLDALEMKGLRKILRVLWTAKKTNEWVLNKAGVKRELLDTVKARMLAYYGHTMRKQGSYLEKEIMQATMPGAPCTQARKTTHILDGQHKWTGLTVEESIRMTRTEVNVESASMVWPTLRLRTAKEQNPSVCFLLSNNYLLYLCEIISVSCMLSDWL